MEEIQREIHRIGKALIRTSQVWPRNVIPGFISFISAATSQRRSGNPQPNKSINSTSLSQTCMIWLVSQVTPAPIVWCHPSPQSGVTAGGGITAARVWPGDTGGYIGRCQQTTWCNMNLVRYWGGRKEWLLHDDWRCTCNYWSTIALLKKWDLNRPSLQS